MENLDYLSKNAKRDYHLVQKAIDGQQRAFAEILNTYEKSIYFMIKKTMKGLADFEDLTIETFRKAFKNSASYKYTFSTCLYRIATNNTIDFSRKKRAETVSIDQGFENDDGSNYFFEIDSGQDNPEQEEIKRVNYALVKESVKAIKPRYRVLIELRFFKDYSYEEITKELNLPLGTVKAQLYRAKHLLGVILGPLKDCI